MQLLSSYLAATVTFLVLDAIWLSQVATRLFSKYISYELLSPPRWGAAAVFYAAYLAAVIWLIVIPGVNQKLTLMQVGLNGFVFGLIAYATYDLTNLATLAGWDWRFAVPDIIWGGCVTAAVAIAAFLAYTGALR